MKRNPGSPANLSLAHVSFSYGRQAILSDIQLEIPKGQFVSILGPSGCGKSTLLRLVSGLEQPSQGIISWEGIAITRPGLEIGVVFQDYSLFPWLTISGNLVLALKKAFPEKNKKQLRALAQDYLELVGLGNSATRYPFELSGGMRQRAAIARALSIGSPNLLLDEPFGALDPVNRTHLQDLLLTLSTHAEVRKTILFVTHDIEEAVYLSDRIIMLGANPGHIIADIPVPFARPRERHQLFASPQYRDLVDQASALFRQDLLRQLDQNETVIQEGSHI